MLFYYLKKYRIITGSNYRNVVIIGHTEESVRLKELFEERNDSIEYLVGTMIEIPRAALTADLIAAKAEFFSFGTNDLTQMAFGYSRDDASKFLPIYIEKGILKVDPFEVLDQEGVGQLVKMGTEKGRSTKPDLNFSGRMLSSIDVERVSTNKVIVGFKRKEEQNKAIINQKSRPFFGVKSTEIGSIETAFRKTFERNI